MSYQVLARKWRPQTFHQLVGQDHVKQALVNALNEQRLHHAYLFTGTRGVGKTTIARIFAKSLNCEQGISAQPCGQCSTCLDIESGRYIDLIEIDAASRTKVEDTREILDNVQYAPTRGQFKVYLIDEVHMLSKHSFNALLKTLEEPPEHVKFLLATTDPQKLPVTILSRCLQFNLSALSVNQITTQLQNILSQEQIHFEQPALEVLAKAADGSMRDALSLTDQAIAQTNAQLQEGDVKDMLGLMDVRYAQQLLSAVLLQDGEELMKQTRNLASRNPNYVAVLDDLLNLTHCVQLTQLVPSAAALSERDSEYVSEVAQSADPQHIHLLYQLLLSGKRDLQWASSAQVGFEMLMLRLLAFEPVYGASDSAPMADMPSAKSKPQERAANLRAMLAKNTTEIAQRERVQNESTGDDSARDDSARPELARGDSTRDDSTRDDSTRDHSTQPSAASAQQPITSMPAAHDSAVAMNQQMQGDAHSQTSEELEAQAAAQFDAVMNQAQDLGFQAQSTSDSQIHAADVQPQSTENVAEPLVKQQQAQQAPQEDAQPNEQTEVAPAEQLNALEEQTQSAIARILQNRKLGTAKPAPASGGNEKKTEARGERAEISAPQTQKLADHSNTPAASEYPAQSNVVELNPPPQPKRPSSMATKRNQTPAERLMERHQPDPNKLAPELLQQLEAPSTSEANQEPVLQIPVPAGFTSPISAIKYAHEQDAWAKLIEDMNLGGRTRQFALHSMFKQQQGDVYLDVHQEQQHLDGGALRDRIAECLSEQLGQAITLHVQFVEQVENTPYLIQQSIDELRLHQAVQTVNEDSNIQRLMSQFSATLDENSVQAL
ncbi:DNA polymerase III subunit gamma/tau [Pseudoalteromonas sp. GB56]